MKNKFKKVIATSLAVSVLLAFTGCGSNQAPSADNKKQESASTSTTDTAGMDEQSKKRDDLYQQENQLFADHKDAWDKVFGLMNKNSAGESLSENYADLLAGTVESNKDSFTEEEYEGKQYAMLTHDKQTVNGSFYFGMSLLVPVDNLIETFHTPEENADIIKTWCVKMKPDANGLYNYRAYAAWELRDKQFREREAFINLIAHEALCINHPIIIQL